MKHTLESVNLNLECSNNSLNITSDAINLVSFIKDELKNIDLKGNVLDIGSGIGTLIFLLYNQQNFVNKYAIEIQKEVFDILKKNVENNNLKIKIYNDDIKNIYKNFENSFEFVISNPPFYKVNSGKLPNNDIIAKSKFEICLKLEELFEITYKILKNNSYFFLIIPLERKKTIDKLSTKLKLISYKIFSNSKKNFITLCYKK